MKKKTFVAAASVLFGACLATQAAYRTEATVTPSGAAHQYVVQFKITDTAKDGKAEVLSAPQVVVEAGKQAQVSVGDDQSQSGVFCTAIVREVADGVEAVTTVTIKDKGIEKLSSTQSITVKK